MFHKTVISSFILLASFLSAGANADLIQTDWKSTGDGLASIDTTSGIEWIDLSLTRNYSIDSILHELAEGGKFYGWRLPTELEVITLITNAFGQEVLGISSSTRNGNLVTKGFTMSEVLHFTRTVGGGSYGTNGYLYGGAYFKRDNGTQGVSGFISINNTTGTSGWYFNPLTTTTPDIIGHHQYGVYLVSDGGLTLSSINNPEININNPKSPINQVSDVSAHAGLGILGMFLMCLGFRRLRS